MLCAEHGAPPFMRTINKAAAVLYRLDGLPCPSRETFELLNGYIILRSNIQYVQSIRYLRNELRQMDRAKLLRSELDTSAMNICLPTIPI